MPTVVLDAEVDDPAVSVGGARTRSAGARDGGPRAAGTTDTAGSGSSPTRRTFPATRLRLRGYRAALKRRRHRRRPRPDPSLRRPTTEGGYLAARGLLGRADRPTALFCFRDLMAMGAYQAAAELGLRVPDDVSIVGYDNMRLVAEGLFPGPDHRRTAALRDGHLGGAAGCSRQPPRPSSAGSAAG